MTIKENATQADENAVEPQDDQNKATDQSPPEDAKPEEQDKPKKTAWYTRVIAREAAEKREAKREADLLKGQNAMLLQELANKNGGSDVKTSPSLAQAEIERLAEEKANIRDFNKACNRIAEEGNDEFEDFDASVSTLQQIGGNYKSLLEITTELTDGHRVLYHLGKDPEEAERLLSLPPTKMAMAVAKLETKLSKESAKTVSDAPSPITPIKAKASKSFDPNDPNADRDEWSKWREKTRRKR